MPFELFANENCEFQNEAKMNAIFERGSAQHPSVWVLSLLRQTTLLIEELVCKLHSLL